MRSFQAIVDTITPHLGSEDTIAPEVLDGALENAAAGLAELHPEIAERVTREWRMEREQRLAKTGAASAHQSHPPQDDVERAIVAMEQQRDAERRDGPSKKKVR
jgi:hypothetical protein